MNKSIFAVISILAILFSCSTAFAQAHQLQAEIIYVEGSVFVKQSIDSDWVDAKVGMVLEKNAVVRVGEGSKCDIVFDGNKENIIGLSKNTEISLSDAAPRSVQLVRGRVFSLIKNYYVFNPIKLK